MSYETSDRGEMSAYATSVAYIAAQPPGGDFAEPYVAMLLDFHGERPNAAWEGYTSCARQLAAALLNEADKADALKEKSDG